MNNLERETVAKSSTVSRVEDGLVVPGRKRLARKGQTSRRFRVQTFRAFSFWGLFGARCTPLSKSKRAFLLPSNTTHRESKAAGLLGKEATHIPTGSRKTVLLREMFNRERGELCVLWDHFTTHCSKSLKASVKALERILPEMGGVVTRIK